MARYEWTGDGEFRDGRNDRTVEPGATIELDEHVGEVNDELVRVEEDVDEPEAAGDEEPDEEPSDDENEAEEDDVEVDPHPSDLTVDELEAGIADVDDPALLEALRSEEADGEGRTTALEAIDERIDAVSE